MEFFYSIYGCIIRHREEESDNANGEDIKEILFPLSNGLQFLNRDMLKNLNLICPNY